MLLQNITAITLSIVAVQFVYNWMSFTSTLRLSNNDKHWLMCQSAWILKGYKCAFRLRITTIGILVAEEILLELTWCNGAYLQPNRWVGTCIPKESTPLPMGYSSVFHVLIFHLISSSTGIILGKVWLQVKCRASGQQFFISRLFYGSMQFYIL